MKFLAFQCGCLFNSQQSWSIASKLRHNFKPKFGGQVFYNQDFWLHSTADKSSNCSLQLFKTCTMLLLSSDFCARYIFFYLARMQYLLLLNVVLVWQPHIQQSKKVQTLNIYSTVWFSRPSRITASEMHVAPRIHLNHLNPLESTWIRLNPLEYA